MELEYRVLDLEDQMKINEHYTSISYNSMTTFSIVKCALRGSVNLLTTLIHLMTWYAD